MDTTKTRKALIADVVNTAGVIAILLAIFVAWRTRAGQDNGVARLFPHFF